MTVDLVRLQVRAEGIEVDFELDDNARQRLLDGADDITITLRHAEEIDRVRAEHPGLQAEYPGR